MSFLNEILQRVRGEVAAAEMRHSLAECKKMAEGAPPVRPFGKALSNGFGLIAEIKRRSPSGGAMREENFSQAPSAYAESTAVRAVSVLTNASDFGMSIEELARIRSLVNKPVLRKDFIFTEYQVYEARAYGADAILLMANVVSGGEMAELHSLASSLGMDVLFEAHTPEEVRAMPPGARIYGLNSRKFVDTKNWQRTQKELSTAAAQKSNARDFTVDSGIFELVKHLPPQAIKVAESGLAPDQIKDVIRLGFDAALIGTSLLKAPEGVRAALARFEEQIADV